MEVALAASDALFGRQIRAVFAEIMVLLGGRKVGDLSEAKTAQYMALCTRLDALVTEEKRFVEADVARRLGSRDGSERSDA